MLQENYNSFLTFMTQQSTTVAVFLSAMDNIRENYKIISSMMVFESDEDEPLFQNFIMNDTIVLIMKIHGRLRFIKNGNCLYDPNGLPCDVLTKRKFLTFKTANKKMIDRLAAQSPMNEMTITGDDGTTHRLEEVEVVQEEVIPKEKSSKKAKSKNGNSSLLKKNIKLAVQPLTKGTPMKTPSDEMLPS